jgi:hypothetical protein
VRRPERARRPLLDVRVGAVVAVELGDVLSSLVCEEAGVAPTVGVHE